MIIQTAPADKPRPAIMMHEHTALAGQFARAFGNERFEPIENCVLPHDCRGSMPVIIVDRPGFDDRRWRGARAPAGLSIRPNSSPPEKAGPRRPRPYRKAPLLRLNNALRTTARRDCAMQGTRCAPRCVVSRAQWKLETGSPKGRLVHCGRIVEWWQTRSNCHGWARGIGEAISKALKAAGYKVAANYGGNDWEAAHKFKAVTGIPVYKWDVSSYESCFAAGITRDSMFHRMTPEHSSAVINTNLNSLFNMCRPVIEGMRSRKFGRIINISSINGQKGQMGQANYSAAKAGSGFTKALAQENARSGITVKAICPGYIATEMVKAVPKDVLEKNILPQIPLGRLGEPEEVARCVLFHLRRRRLHHRLDAVGERRPSDDVT